MSMCLVHEVHYYCYYCYYYYYYYYYYYGINFKSSNVTFRNQVAQNAYYDINKRAQTTALFRALQKCCI